VENGDLVARLGRQRLLVPDGVGEERKGIRSFVGRDVVLGIRPEDIEDAAFARDGASAGFEVDVALAEPLGAEVIGHLELDSPTDPLALVARLSPRTRADTGDRLTVVVDADRLHFFDPRDGTAIR